MLKAEILKIKMLEACERLSRLEKEQVLVLSTGYEPLFKTNWKRAMSAVMSGRAEVVETHESLWIGTATGQMPLPIVVRFITGIIAAKLRSTTRPPKPTKKMLWKRDEGKCQYCEKKVSLSTATIDHVIPRSRGGKETWKNLVIACSKCNCKKGSSLTSECGMKPLKTPVAPALSIYFKD